MAAFQCIPYVGKIVNGCIEANMNRSREFVHKQYSDCSEVISAIVFEAFWVNIGRPTRFQSD